MDGLGHATVHDRKGEVLYAIGLAERRLLGEVQLGDLITRQGTNNYIDTG
jgi:hypothetical protein